jgi:outer membrane receptor for ferrienterochelin and colicins
MQTFYAKPAHWPLALAVVLFVLTIIQAPPVLAHGGALEEMVVTAVRTQRTLDDTPLRVQILGKEELREKANMKPGDIRMLLNESTGIQVQQTSASSFNSNIRIQGLDGRYTQLLRDGLPIYSGFSGSLSLLQIAPLDLEQVEVIKGASSTLYGGGAIAGLVNLVSKRPHETPETALMLNGTSAEGIDLSAFHSRESGKHGATVFASYNRNNAWEAEDNGLTAIPEFERVTLTPRWFYTASDNTDIDLGLGFIDENRLGGSIDYINGSAPGDYFEENDSRRYYTRAGISHQLANEANITLKNTNSWFDRSLATPGHLFSGTQFSTFTEFALTNTNNNDDWVLGLNALTEEFDQDQQVPGFDHDYKEHTLGLFGQYTRDVTSSIIIEGGLRVDSHSEYGNFLLPRVSVLYLPAPDVTLRLGGGYGYKTPTVFISEAEELQYKNIVPIDPDEFDAETSKGLNVDINHRLDTSGPLSLNSNLLLFYTQIDDSIQIVERGNTHVFSQSEGKVKTHGAEINLIFGYNDWRYFVGYTYVDATRETLTGDSEMPLVSKHRFNQMLVWEKEDDFRIGLEAYYFSEQQREGDTTGRDYWIFGIMSEKKLGAHITAFLNFENFTDTRQTRYEDINAGDLVNPAFRDIYAPLDGFVANGGVRVTW